MQMGFFFFSVWLLGKLERRKDMLLNCHCYDLLFGWLRFSLLFVN